MKVNGKDYPIYYGKYQPVSEITNQTIPFFASFTWLVENTRSNIYRFFHNIDACINIIDASIAITES